MYMHNWGSQNMWFINMPFGLGAMFGGLILVALLWSIVWKGLALWHSGRRGQAWWFVIMLVVNTLGILEIIYLFGVAKLRFDQLFTKGHSHEHTHPHHDHAH
jgi:methionyl-tRNA synthetase